MYNCAKTSINKSNIIIVNLYRYKVKIINKNNIFFFLGLLIISCFYNFFLFVIKYFLKYLQFLLKIIITQDMNNYILIIKNNNSNHLSILPHVIYHNHERI